MYKIHTFIVFIHFYCAYHSMSLSEALPTLCRSLHAEALWATVSEGLAQGPYVADRAGFEQATLRLNVVDSTNAPPRPTCIHKVKPLLLFMYLIQSLSYNVK